MKIITIPDSAYVGIVKAVSAIPITGSKDIDARFLATTGFLESRYVSPTLDHPGGSAVGYYGLTKPCRTEMARLYGIPFSYSPIDQAKVAAAYYSYLLKQLHLHPSKVFFFSKDPLTNTLLNLRLRYAAGMGSQYVNKGDGATAVPRIIPYLPLIIDGLPANQGDVITSKPNAKLKFMSTTLEKEYPLLPLAVRQSVDELISMFDPGTSFFVSSIVSSYTGEKRTETNGPNHASCHAIDIVPTPFDTPMFLDQAGNARSPHFNWNLALQAALLKGFKAGLFPAPIFLESDHIHIDDTHPVGIYTYSSHRPHYHNDDMSSCMDVKVGELRKLS